MTERTIGALALDGDVDALRNRLRQKPVPLSLPDQIDGVLKLRVANFKKYHKAIVDAVGPYRHADGTPGVKFKRYGVLATKHAPKDVERYRADVESEIQRALDHYAQMTERTREAARRLESGSGYTTPVSSVSVEIVRGLLEGLTHNADLVASAASITIGKGASVPNLAVVHDAVVDVFEAFDSVLLFAHLCTEGS